MLILREGLKINKATVFCKDKRQIPFPRKKVIAMGEVIERVLEKKTPSREEKDLLEYARVYLLFRKYLFSEKKNPYLRQLYEAEKKLDIGRDSLLALNLWLRGSRNNLEEFFPKEELCSLLSRVRSKLENLSP